MCKKDGPEPLTSEVVQENRSPLPLILSFLSKVNSTDVEKNLGFYAADSVEWYVEAALNYGDTYPTGDYDDYAVDTVITTVPLSAGEATDADVLNAYQTLDGLLANIPVISGNTVVLIDVFAQQEGDNLVLNTYRVTGTPSAKVLNTTYVPGQSYRSRTTPGFGCGCGIVVPYKCADRTIQDRVKNHITFPIYPNQYLTNVQIWTVAGWSGWPTDLPSHYLAATDFPNPVQPLYPENSNITYRVYKREWLDSFENIEPCLSPADMSYLTQNTYGVMVQVRNTYQPAQQLINISIVGKYDILIGNPIRNYFHSCQFTYGNIYSGSNG